MKRIFSIILFFVMLFVFVLNIYAVSFSDIEGHWAQSYIIRWADEKVINGYEDGTFRPNNNITRAEYVAMLVRIYKPIQMTDLSNYQDVDRNSWYYESLSKAVAMEIIKGYDENTISPNANITRQEAVVILNRILKLNSSSSDVSYSDENTIADWAKESVLAFTEKKYLNGYEDGTIRPNSPITRAEIAKILDKAIELKEIPQNVVNEENTNSETKTNDSFVLELTTNGNKYDVKKQGTIKDGVKLTLIVDGNTIISDKTFSESNFSKLKIDLMTSIKSNVRNKNISIDKFLNTLNEYDDGESKKGIIALIPEEDKELFEQIFGTDGSKIGELNKDLTDDDFLDLATIFIDIDYNSLLKMLDNI